MLGAPSSTNHHPKVLNACDECRTRKLKCSGEPTGCSRCLADGVPCHYSPRKQMGRPRKRRREGEEATSGLEVGNEATSGLEVGNEAETGGWDTTGGKQTLPENLFADASLEPDMLGLDGSEHFNPALLNSDLSQMSNIADSLFNMSSYSGLSETGLPDLAIIPGAQVPQSPFPDLSNLTPGATTNVPPTKCRCLSKLYVTLFAFQSPPAPSFPYSIASLKRATKVAGEAVRCPHCVQEFNSALQNSMLLSTLLNLIISEYQKLLEHIDERGARDDRIPFRMGENSPENAHLHTGTLDCPMGINIELDGTEWKLLARKVVANEIYGTGEQTCLLKTIEEMRERQIVWHSRHMPSNPYHKLGEDQSKLSATGGGCICVQLAMIDRLLLLLDSLKLR